LSTAQSHLHKEAIRQAYLALADHDVKTGSTSQGLGELMRAIDYCTNRQQTCQISLKIIEVAFSMEQYATVREFANKIEHTVGSFSSSSLSSSSSTAASGAAEQMQDIKIKVGIAKGIERMISGDYKSSAQILIPLVLKSGNVTRGSSSSTDSGGTGGSNSSGNLLEWPGVTSPKDVAIYASMMALVTQDRARILELAEHPEALELVPAMKELLLQCSRANYVQCMRTFVPSPSSEADTMQHQQHQHQQELLPFSLSPIGTDVYVTPSRWNAISHKIREMCLIQYLKPYQCVKLESMHRLFYPAIATVDDLQDVLVDLMSRELLPPNMRLDTRSNILHQIKPSMKKSTMDKINVMEERVLDDTYAMLIRLACLESDLVIHDPNHPSGAVGGRGGRSGRSAGGRARGRNMGGGIHSFGGGGEASGSATDPVDVDEDESDGDYDAIFDNSADAVDMMAEGTDSQMMDAEAMNAMNPEDMY
jgi:uncharacterized membrane protein YgcG